VKILRALCLSLCLSLVTSAMAQTSIATPSALPHLVRFGGVVKDLNGNPLTGVVGITFALYGEQTGGAPLWLETQNVTADSNGHYAALLGSTKPNGLPPELFTSVEARWVGVQVSGQAEQARVLLVSAPYAFKAGDAETIGGLPPSAFVLAAAPQSSAASTPPNAGMTPQTSAPPPSGAITGTGSVNFLPLWDSTSDIISSVLFQSGTGSAAKIGINTTAPASTLDVKGGATIRGILSLPATGVATATAGKNSQPVNLAASAFNSSTSTAVNQTFQWLAEPAGNDTTTPSGTLNLLFGEGATKPSETGLNIASNGAVTATSFSGNGSGLTNVTAANSTELGGLAPSAFAQLATSTNIFTGGITAASFSGNGSGLTSVTAANASELGGLLPSAYQPAGSYATTGSNTFNGDQNITGNLAATGSVSGAAATFTGVVTEAGALLPAGGTATAAQGFNSQPLDSVASVFNSTGGTAQNQDFQWLAEPVGNNTSSPSGKLNLLFGANGATPTETGLSVANNGIITFATGQAFLGAGSVTSVGSGAGLTGGPITTTGSLSIAPGGVSNAMLANPSLTITTAGSDLTGGGVVALGGSIALNVDTTKIPQLAAANTFAGTQSINAITGNGLFTTTSDSTASGVLGINYATSGAANGVYGFSDSSSGTGVLGYGLAAGVSGTSNGLTGSGVVGVSNAISGAGIGVYGKTATSAGYGVEGFNTATTGSAIGVYGQSNSTAGFAVAGVNNATSGAGVGVYGQTSGSTGYGVEGFNFATTGNAYGVYGASESSSGSGVYGNSNGGTGVTGLTSSATGTGVVGINTAGGTAGSFLGNVGITGNVSIAANNGNSYQIGGVPFAFGSFNANNAFLGFAGNSSPSNTGTANTAIGFAALEGNTAGLQNTASGAQALFNNNGNYNTAYGYKALVTNTTGSLNTALGYLAGPDNSNVINNATAIGAYADVTASNALVLGGITGTNGCGTGNNCATVKVGIGTTAPTHAFEVDSAGASSAQIEMLSTGTDAAISLNNRGTGGREYWIDSGSGSAGVGNGNFAVWDNDAGALRLVITSGGNVGIGTTTSPSNLLTLKQGGGVAVGDGWSVYSSRRWKSNIQTLHGALAKVEHLRGVSYDLKGSGKHEVGVIAEEVGAVVPEVVTYEDNGKDARGVDYSRLTALLIEATKEQQTALSKALREIKQQQSLLLAQSAAMKSLKAEVRETRETLRKVKAQMAAAQPALVAQK